MPHSSATNPETGNATAQEPFRFAWRSCSGSPADIRHAQSRRKSANEQGRFFLIHIMERQTVAPTSCDVGPRLHSRSKAFSTSQLARRKVLWLAPLTSSSHEPSPTFGQKCCTRTSCLSKTSVRKLVCACPCLHSKTLTVQFH
jgi:hypothetical protein